MRKAGFEEIALTGMDVSKHAAKLAAKHYPRVFFFVSNVSVRIPLKNDSVSLLYSIFAPRNIKEFARVVARGGYAIIVIPRQNHLSTIREQFGLLRVEADKEERVLELFTKDFDCVEKRDITIPIKLGHEAIAQLIRMGPNFYHASVSTDIPQVRKMHTDASFTAQTFCKR